MSGIATAVVGSAVIGGVASNMAAKKAAKAQQSSADAATQLQREMYEQQREDQAPWRNVGGNALNQLAMLLGIDGYSMGNTPGSLNGQDLVMIENGVPVANPDLYASNAAYRDAWDRGLAHHVQKFGGGFRFDSDPNAIESYLKRELADEMEGEKQVARDNPLYGSLMKRFSAEDFQTDPGYEFRLGQGQRALESSAAARGGLLSGAAAKALTKYNQDFASNEYQNAYNRFTNDQTNMFNRLANIAGVGQTATNQLGQAGQNYATNAGNAMQYAGTARASGYTNSANALNSALGSASSALVNFSRPQYFSNNPYGTYSATSYGVPDYYSGVNGVPLS